MINKYSLIFITMSFLYFIIHKADRGYLGHYNSEIIAFFILPLLYVPLIKYIITKHFKPIKLKNLLFLLIVINVIIEILFQILSYKFNLLNGNAPQGIIIISTALMFILSTFIMYLYNTFFN